MKGNRFNFNTRKYRQFIKAFLTKIINKSNIKVIIIYNKIIK